jgi:SPW repeat
MSKWTHPQGLAALIAGLYAALCPLWTTMPTDTNKATYTMIALGVITAALALFDLAIPGRIAFEGLIALMGVLFIVSPWVMSFNTGFTALAWTAWIVGIVALVAGAADVQMTHTGRSHGTVAQH